MRVELQERVETIEQFQELIYTGEVSWREFSNVSIFDQVFALVAFLDKYDCARALKDLIDVLTRSVSCTPSAASVSKAGVEASEDGVGQLPPLVLFAVGARLSRPEVCRAALDLPDWAWGEFRRWMHPHGLIKPEVTNTLHPHGIPYKLLTELPFEYVLALALTPVNETVDPNARGGGRCGDLFVKHLDKFKAAAEEAKEMPGQQ